MKWIRTYEAFGNELETAIQVVITMLGEVERLYKVTKHNIPNEWGNVNIHVPEDIVVLELLEYDRYTKEWDDFESMMTEQCPRVFFRENIKNRQIVLGTGSFDDYCLKKLNERFPYFETQENEKILKDAPNIYTYKTPEMRFDQGLAFYEPVLNKVKVNNEVWILLDAVMCMGWRSGDAQRLVGRWLNDILSWDLDVNRTTYDSW
jgi:hypothetical protein